MRPSLVVDLADVSTWPGEAETVLRGKADSDDPEGDDDDLEKSLRAALAGRSILAYHGTRLLPAEAAAVRQVGLRVLTNDLRQTKLQSAGVYLSVDEVPLVRRAMEPLGHPRLHVFAPLAGADTAGVRPLVENWGGEIIYGKCAP